MYSCGFVFIQKLHFFNMTLSPFYLSASLIITPLVHLILVSIKVSYEQSLRAIDHRNRVLVKLKITP